jgi:hypothetical protein
MRPFLLTGGAGTGDGGGGSDAPLWVLGSGGSGNTPATIDFDFANQRYYQTGQASNLTGLLTLTRASMGTDLLPTSASGAAFNTFASGAPRITPGKGLLVEEARTNLYLNSGAPATQTITLGVGTFVCWVNGIGTIVVTLGTAVGSGTGIASQGSPVNLVITTGGTVIFTLGSTLNTVQVEQIGTSGTFGTSYIPTAGASVTRAADNISLKNYPVFGAGYTFLINANSAVTAAQTAGPISFMMDDGSNNNRILFTVNGTPVSSLFVESGGVGATINLVGSWAGGAIGRTALALTAGAQSGTFNSGTIGTATSALPVSPTEAYIGSNHGASLWWNSYIRRVTIWPTIAQTNAYLQYLTSGAT